MATKWLASFKEIPWHKALSVAPSIAEGGRKLWARVARRSEDSTGSPVAAPQPGASPSEFLAAFEVRVHGLETRIARVEEESASSHEVVRSLAEQHSQLVGAVDALIARTSILLRVCIALGILAIALLILVLMRW